MSDQPDKCETFELFKKKVLVEAMPKIRTICWHCRKECGSRQQLMVDHDDDYHTIRCIYKCPNCGHIVSDVTFSEDIGVDKMIDALLLAVSDGASK